MNKELTKEECLNAGAWYRIWKDVSTTASVEIAKSLHLTNEESSKMRNTVDKIYKFENRLGFEARADRCFPSNSDLFYGALGMPIRSTIDREVNETMFFVILELLNKLCLNNGRYLDPKDALTNIENEIQHSKFEAKKQSIDDELMDGLSDLINQVFKEDK